MSHRELDLQPSQLARATTTKRGLGPEGPRRSRFGTGLGIVPKGGSFAALPWRRPANRSKTLPDGQCPSSLSRARGAGAWAPCNSASHRVGTAVLMQALIYNRKRFVRILGVTHVVWLPMVVWMAFRLPAIPADEHSLRCWLVTLMVTNVVSLGIDAWDAVRFLRGERSPYYAW